jgi:uncharacterized protein (TIGR02598 family)
VNLLNSSPSGFSLVEVAVAVAVIAIGLLVILGLFPQGLQSARNAADNTMSATIAQDLFSYIRTQPFNYVDLGDGSGPQSLESLFPITLHPLYFDQAGFSTNAPSAYYFRVMVGYQPQTPLALCLVRATVLWPAPAGVVNPINANIFITQVTWYDNHNP